MIQCVDITDARTPYIVVGCGSVVDKSEGNAATSLLRDRDVARQLRGVILPSGRATMVRRGCQNIGFCAFSSSQDIEGAVADAFEQIRAGAAVAVPLIGSNGYLGVWQSFEMLHHVAAVRGVRLCICDTNFDVIQEMGLVNAEGGPLEEATDCVADTLDEWKLSDEEGVGEEWLNKDELSDEEGVGEEVWLNEDDLCEEDMLEEEELKEEVVDDEPCPLGFFYRKRAIGHVHTLDRPERIEVQLPEQLERIRQLLSAPPQQEATRRELCTLMRDALHPYSQTDWMRYEFDEYRLYYTQAVMYGLTPLDFAEFWRRGGGHGHRHDRELALSVLEGADTPSRALKQSGLPTAIVDLVLNTLNAPDVHLYDKVRLLFHPSFNTLLQRDLSQDWFLSLNDEQDRPVRWTGTPTVLVGRVFRAPRAQWEGLVEGWGLPWLGGGLRYLYHGTSEEGVCAIARDLELQPPEASTARWIDGFYTGTTLRYPMYRARLRCTNPTEGRHAIMVFTITEEAYNMALDNTRVRMWEGEWSAMTKRNVLSCAHRFHDNKVPMYVKNQMAGLGRTRMRSYVMAKGPVADSLKEDGIPRETEDEEFLFGRLSTLREFVRQYGVYVCVLEDP